MKADQRDAVPLELRQIPVQARARESRAKILETAAELLDEVGIDDFNTNLLAERAGVRVRTVYRYFPNKVAVIATVGEEMFERWAVWNARFFEDIANPGIDWAVTLEKMIEGWINRLGQEKGARALLQAMGSVPQLRDMDVAAYASLVLEFETAFSHRQPCCKTDIAVLCHIIVSSIYGLIDCYYRAPAEVQPLMATELASMIVARARPIIV